MERPILIRFAGALGSVLARFALSSLGCAAVDLAIFATLAHGGMGVGVAVLAARAVSSLLNFFCNRRYVFRSDRPLLVAVLLYYLLVAAVGVLSYALTVSLSSPGGLPLVVGKALADSLLFLASYLAQRYLVFTGRAPSSFVTPAGAGIAIVCFFLPWVRISCVRDYSFTGLEIAHLKAVYWLVLGGEVAVVALWLLRRPLLAAAAALVPLAVIFAPVLRGERSRIDLDLQIGAYGTVLGLVVAAMGTISRRALIDLANRSRRRRSPPGSAPPA